MKYIKNADLEENLINYSSSGEKHVYDTLCEMFFLMSKKLVYYVMKKRKYRYDKFLIDDLVSAGTHKAIREMGKFDKTGKHKKAKAFNFFTTVIINEMTQELMKQENKTWYRDESKVKRYIERAKYKSIIDPDIEVDFSYDSESTDYEE